MSHDLYSPTVNERASRIVGGFVVALSLVAIGLESVWLAGLLSLDFILRVLFGPRLSPLARAAGALAPRLGPPIPIPAAPKQFAAAIGAVMSAAAAALIATHHAAVAVILLATLALFAALEALMAFCLGCWLYGRLQNVGLFPADACVDCRPERSEG